MKFEPDLRSPATSQNSIGLAPIRTNLHDYESNHDDSSVEASKA